MPCDISIETPEIELRTFRVLNRALTKYDSVFAGMFGESMLYYSPIN